MWIHHTRDSSVWAANGLLYAEAVHLAQGSLGAKANFRIRRNEHAEHGPPGIHSHRNGDKSSTLCRIPNLGQARVVVTNG